MAETIWAVTMVRDEADVIEDTVRHLLAEGVDRVLVADNMSRDGTREILDRLAAELPVTVVDDRDPAYRQSEKMTALARQAGEAGATWVIPFDADELWVAPGGTLRGYLSGVGEDVAAADLYSYRPSLLPRRGSPFRVMRWRNREPGFPKVAFRYAPDITVEMGNHSVTADRSLRVRHDGKLEVHHFPCRSFGQMVRKFQQGAAALALTDQPDHICWHWRLQGGRTRRRLFLSWVRMCVRRDGLVRDEGSRLSSG